VLVGGVVGDEVEDDPQAESVRVGEQRVDVGERSRRRGRRRVVGDVVAVVRLGEG
jgi:hypothetical protein